MKLEMEVIDSNTFFGPSPSPATDLSLDLLGQAIQKHGISRACTLSTVGFLHNWVEGNAATAAACEGKPELIPVATIDPRGFFPSTRIPDSLSGGCFKMVRFFPDEQDWPINYAPFTAILDQLEPAGLPVMISAARSGQATALLEWAKGRGARFVLTGTSYEGIAEAVAVMRKADNIFIETDSLIACGAIELIVKEIGADRVIFGSGCPTASLAGALRQIQFADLPDTDKQKILSENIKRILPKQA